MRTGPAYVAIIETGPRNSRPHDPPLDQATHHTLVDRLVQAGLRDLVVGGPRDSIAALPRHPDTRYALLAGDLDDIEATLATGVTELTLSAPCTDSAGRRLHGGDVEAGLRRLEPLARLAADHAVRLRGHLTQTVVCPDEGPVDPHHTADLCVEMRNLGCFEVSLDAGAVNRSGAVRILWDVCAGRVGPDRLAIRLGRDHLACLGGLLPLGLQTIDTSVGGLGPDRLVATEDVVALLDSLDIATGIDIDVLTQTAWWLGARLGCAPASRCARLRPPEPPTH